MRPNISMKMGNYYWGGPPVCRYYVQGVRVPRGVWRIFYRWLEP